MFEDEEQDQPSVPLNLPVASEGPAPTSAPAPAPRSLGPKPQSTGKFTSAGWAAVILLGLLAAAGATYGYYRIVVLSPANIVRSAVENLQKLNSGSVTYELTLSLLPTTGVGGAAPTAQDEIHLRANARTDFNRAADHVQTATDIKYDLTGGATRFLFDESSIHPSFSLLSADKQNIFVKLNGIPPLPFIDLSKLNDQWIQLPASDGAAASIPSGALNITQEEFWRQVGTAYRAQPFLALQPLPTEPVQGAPALHYKAAVDKIRFAEFLRSLRSSLQPGTSTALAGDWKSALDNLDLSAELWIGQADRQFKRVMVSGTTGTSAGKIQFKIDSALEKPNAPITIQPPASFIPLEEAILRAQPFEGGPRADDQQTLDDIARLQGGIEQYHGEQDQYPFLIADGSRLGVDVVCLGATGFAQDLGICRKAGTVYMEAVPAASDSPAHDYRYSLCKEDTYTIEFYLYTDRGEAKAGTNYARYDGISQEPDTSEECADPDQDGLSNYFEAKYKTDPLRPDTDGDGFLDGNEIANGFNPLGAGRLRP